MSKDSITALTNEVQVPDPKSSVVPIALEQAERPNKYLYFEFEGAAGERYLDMLCQQILPQALWRTWRYAVLFQAPGHECYVGVSRIAERVKPGERKIYLDLAELAGRGLLRMFHKRMSFMQDDDSVIYNTVTVKDFSGLYALAHEYHLWLCSPQFIAANRENLEIIQAEDPQLIKKLLRFDNYRRLLLCQKPGRKPQPKQSYALYDFSPTQQQGTDDNQAAIGSTSVPKLNLSLNTSDNVSSPYRKDGIGDSLLEKKDTNSRKDSEDGGEAKTIGSKNTKNPSGTKPNETASQTTNPKTPNNEESVTSQAAQQAENPETTRPSAAAGQASSEVAVETQGAQAQERARRQVPEFIVNTITGLTIEMGDWSNSLPGNITRAAKNYFMCHDYQSGFAVVGQYYFADWIEDAKQEAYNVPVQEVRSKGPQGANYMPLFWTALEGKFNYTAEELRLLRSEELLYEPER